MKAGSVKLNFQLRFAAEAGNLEKVKQLIADGADIHFDGDGALRFAAQEGHLDVVEFLTDNGANIYAKDEYALRQATKNGHAKIAAHLCLRRTATEGVLRLAAETGDLDKVKELVAQGVDIHTWNDYSLRWAAYGGFFEVVQLLIEKGANISADDDCALQCAVERGHLEIAELLIKNGAKLNDDMNTLPEVQEMPKDFLKGRKPTETLTSKFTNSIVAAKKAGIRGAKVASSKQIADLMIAGAKETLKDTYPQLLSDTELGRKLEPFIIAFITHLVCEAYPDQIPQSSTIKAVATYAMEGASNETIKMIADKFKPALINFVKLATQMSVKRMKEDIQTVDTKMLEETIPGLTVKDLFTLEDEPIEKKKDILFN
jgi:hypothetical protein